MSMRKLMAAAAVAASVAIPMAANALPSPTIGISDDARSLVVTVPAGCLASMKLELVYDSAGGREHAQGPVRPFGHQA